MFRIYESPGLANCIQTAAKYFYNQYLEVPQC